ncbi:MAG: WD40 repeat domain-containing protein [Verrucomicrobia bacterium]|nr:WD40 repeat domain-containing protein [Verrucomicrobiota bacterium]
MIVDLTLNKPLVTHVIPQVNDGLESFAFHPNGKMAVVTCLENPSKNSLAVLDIESDPPRLLYHLDAAAASQGVEFTPEGDMLFLGSPVHGRIEVYDVQGEFELVKNPKFIKIGYGHNSLSMGPRYRR